MCEHAVCLQELPAEREDLATTTHKQSWGRWFVLCSRSPRAATHRAEMKNRKWLKAELGIERQRERKLRRNPDGIEALQPSSTRSTGRECQEKHKEATGNVATILQESANKCRKHSISECVGE